MPLFFKVVFLCFILFSDLFSFDGKCEFVSTTTKVIKSFSWTHYDSTNLCFPSNFCSTINFNRNGTTYIATARTGMVVLNGNSCLSYVSNSTSLPCDTIRDMDIDKSGRIWIATSSGLAVFNGVEWTIFNSENSDLPLNSVSSVAADNDTTIWVGCGNATEGGLFKFKNNTWTVFTPDNSILPCRIIQKITIGNDNSVLVGTGQFQGLGGFVVLKDGNWNVFNKLNSIMPYNTVDEIASDRNGVIWIGTEALLYNTVNSDSSGGAIMRFKNNKLEVMDPTITGIASKRLTALAVDSSGNTWIATSANPPRYDYALSIYDGTDWYALSLKNGPLPRMFIPDIVVDRYNNIWLATENGIYMLKELTSSAININLADKKDKIRRISSSSYDLLGRYYKLTRHHRQRKHFQSDIILLKTK